MTVLYVPHVPYKYKTLHLNETSLREKQVLTLVLITQIFLLK